MESLKDKVVVITGAGDGLGKQLAVDLAKRGAKLALISRSGERLEIVRQSVVQPGGEAEAYICDVSDELLVQKTAEKIIKRFGRIDVLINNAGIFYYDERLRKEKGLTAEMFGANSLGTVYMTHAFLPQLKRQNSGEILNVISDSGVRPAERWATYVATKYAITGFTESLKIELKDYLIKVMGFYPDAFGTDIFTKAGGGKVSRTEEWMMPVEEMAKIVLFMLQQPADINIGHLGVCQVAAASRFKKEGKK